MPISPEEIATKEFLTSFRGYDKLEVEAYLRIIAADYRRLLHRLDKVRRAPAASAGPAPEPAPDEPAGEADAAARVGENDWHDLLLLAQEERQQMLRAGEDEKNELVAEGAAQRAEQLRRAEQEARELLDRAAAERTALLDAAQAEADAVRRSATDDLDGLRRSLLDSATAEAELVVTAARERAVALLSAARGQCEALLAEVRTQGALDDALFEDAAHQLQLQRWHREKMLADVVASLQSLATDVEHERVVAAGTPDDADEPSPAPPGEAELVDADGAEPPPE